MTASPIDSERRERVDGQVLATALCHLVSADAPALDPDGSLVRTVWPLTGSFTPCPDVVDDLRAVVELVNSEVARLERYREIDRDALDWHGH